MANLRIPRATAAAAAACVLALAAVPALAGGRVEVRFDDPSKFTDAGMSPAERDETQRLLRGHFEKLADKLSDGQVLSIQVKNVDLAGEVNIASTSHPRMFGVSKLDGPQMDLHYELSAGGKTLGAGDDHLSDANYKARTGGVAKANNDLNYEARMIDFWFADRIKPIAAGKH
jgi:hypothetical protein